MARRQRQLEQLGEAPPPHRALSRPSPNPTLLPAPKIGAVLVLIALILLGVGVIALGSVVVLRQRQPGEARKVQDLYPEGSERAVYETLYGKRSTTVSAPVPVERSPEADGDTPQAGLRE